MAVLGNWLARVFCSAAILDYEQRLATLEARLQLLSEENSRLREQHDRHTADYRRITDWVATGGPHRNQPLFGTMEGPPEETASSIKPASLGPQFGREAAAEASQEFFREHDLALRTELARQLDEQAQKEN